MPIKSAYSNIINAMNNGTALSQELFKNFIEAVNGESIFELSETELMILEFIRSQGRKLSLNLVLSQEDSKTGEVIKKFTPNDKITSDLSFFKHTPYQYVVLIN
jgi:hypothetical protein